MPDDDATGASDADRPDRDLIARLARLPAFDRDTIIWSLGAASRSELNERWELWAHDGQRAPPGNWRVWLIRAGRGFGKTRAGAEWVSAHARATPKARIALVGATIEDVRQVMVEGPSGLIAVARADEKISWRATAGEIDFASGARGFVYSAEAPERLRGGWATTASAMSSRMRASAASVRKAGHGRWRRASPATMPTGWSPRRTMAARWCAAC